MSRRTRGTTLVELLLALALVEIFSVAMLEGMQGGSLKVDRARQRAAALTIARETVEFRRTTARSGSITIGGPFEATIARANGEQSSSPKQPVSRLSFWYPPTKLSAPPM